MLVFIWQTLTQQQCCQLLSLAEYHASAYNLMKPNCQCMCTKRPHAASISWASTHTVWCTISLPAFQSAPNVITSGLEFPLKPRLIVSRPRYMMRMEEWKRPPGRPWITWMKTPQSHAVWSSQQSSDSATLATKCYTPVVHARNDDDDDIWCL